MKKTEKVIQTQKDFKENIEMYTEEFAEKNRWGLRLTNYESLLQMDYYL
jgi:hypothetical protein